MAQHKAQGAAARLPNLSGRRETLANLWQVPTFLAGMLALIGVWTARPLWHVSEQGKIDRALAVLRQTLDQPPSELRQTVSRAEGLLEGFEHFPCEAGEAHLMLGKAYVRLAEAAPDGQAGGDWQAARGHLEQVETLAVPEEDRPRLAFLLGKVWHHDGVDPDRVVACLGPSVDAGAEDRAEGYGLLVEAYLRLPVPDLPAALNANEKQLATPSLNEEVLARARLQRAEILARQEQPDEARTVLTHLLERAGSRTPPEVVYRARRLLAQGYQADQNWQEALPLWEALRTDTRTPPAEQGQVLFSLGTCYRQLGHPAEAAAAWEQARQRSGPERQAANLALAEVRLSGEQPATALEAFSAALEDVTTASDYHNSLIELAAVRAMLENAGRLYCETGVFDLAQQAARLYEKVALAGKGQELFAVAADAWARYLIAHAVPDTDGQISGKDWAAAQAQYHNAATAYETAAGLTRNAAEKADWLWRSADRYSQAKEPEQAVIVLQHYVRLESLSPERLGETWFRIAEAHRAAHHDVAARNAYLECVKYTGPFVYRARYQLAVSDIQRGELDRAEEDLQQNLSLMQQAVADEEATEQTLYTLANLLYQRGEYRLAELRLQEALSRYPANPNAVTTRLRLADCCWKLAMQEGQRIKLSERASSQVRSHYDMLRQKWLEESASHYQKIADDLAACMVPARPLPGSEEGLLLHQATAAVARCRFEQGQYAESGRVYSQVVSGLTARQNERVLTASEDALLREALFGVAKSYSIREQFDEARRLYESMAERYPRQVDGLIALSYAYFCSAPQSDSGHAVLLKIDAMVKAMGPEAFDRSDEWHTKERWQAWVQQNR